MRSARETAEKTSLAKLKKANSLWLDQIQQRIDGAASAGDSTTLVEFQGNQLDHDTTEQIKQVLLEAGYTVSLRHTARTQTYSFTISW